MRIFSILSFVTAVAASSVAVGGVVIDAGFVIGPDNWSASFFGFKGNSYASFNYSFSNEGGTLQTSPQAYNPLFTGDVIGADSMVARTNSWLAQHDPPSPFGNEDGNFVWSFARIYSSDGTTEFVLDDLRYELTDTSGVLSASGSYATGNFEDSLTRSVIGIDYGADDALGGGDDTTYISGNGTTPVNEIRVFADFGIAEDGSSHSGSGQTQLDNALAALIADTPFQLTNSFWLDGTSYEGGSAIWVTADGEPPAPGSDIPEPTTLMLLGLGALGLARRRRR